MFFFQAEDGIRDHCVTGVQTCALPISEEKYHSKHTDATELRTSHLTHYTGQVLVSLLIHVFAHEGFV